MSVSAWEVSPITRPVRSVSLADAVALRVPLCYVVETDPLWADAALTALLEEVSLEHSRDDSVLLGGGPVVARWSRTRGWRMIGNPFAQFALVQAVEPEEVGRRDVLEDLLGLSAHLRSLRDAASNESHPYNGSVLWMRGLAPELDRPVVVEALFDLVVLLREREASLLLEVEADLEPRMRAARLGPSVSIPDNASIRYQDAVTEVVAGAIAAGAAQPDRADVLELFSGLSQMQADLVARIVRAEISIARLHPRHESVPRGLFEVDYPALVDSARQRVLAVMRG